MRTVSLAWIGVDALESVLPAVAPFLQSMALRSGGRYETVDIIDLLRNAQMQLWVAVRDGAAIAALVTQLVEYPRLKACAIRGCAGSEREAWMHFMADIRRWAKAEGCALIEAQARPGWERVLKGFRKTHVAIEETLA